MAQELKNKKTKVFASYHYVALNGKANGFGNWIGEFDVEGYKDDLGGFILAMQQTIENMLEEQSGLKASIKIMFYR